MHEGINFYLSLVLETEKDLLCSYSSTTLMREDGVVLSTLRYYFGNNIVGAFRRHPPAPPTGNDESQK